MTQSPKSQRHFKNILLQPYVQIRLGIYSTVLAFLFAAVIAFIVYWHFGKVYDMVLDLTDVREEVGAIVASYLAPTKTWLGCSILIFLLANVCLTIIFTHKLVGPTYAFRRHLICLQNGEYSARTKLRKGDSFQEVADELNKLSEMLEKKNRS